MNIDLDYSSFCNIYYKDAEEVAEITIAEHIKKHAFSDEHYWANAFTSTSHNAWKEQR